MTATSDEVTVLDDDGWDGPEPTATEMEQWQRDAVLASGDKIEPELFPRMHNTSAGFMYRTIVRPDEPQRPGYVTVPVGPGLDDAETSVAVSRWNMLWAAGQFRRRFFDEDDLPRPLATLVDQGDINIQVVPRTTSRYFEFAPLYHLLPRATLERFGLPLLHGGQWPLLAQVGDVDRWLPDDFHPRLARAWAYAVWPRLMPGSPPSAFTRDDPSVCSRTTSSSGSRPSPTSFRQRGSSLSVAA